MEADDRGRVGEEGGEVVVGEGGRGRVEAVGRRAEALLGVEGSEAGAGAGEGVRVGDDGAVGEEVEVEGAVGAAAHLAGDGADRRPGRARRSRASRGRRRC